MILTDKAIANYLPELKKAAFNNGYLWIMLLVARELDFKEGYKELFDSWSSFDSLTGKRIMFLFSDNTGDQIGLNYFMGQMDICKGISGLFNFSDDINLYHLSRKDVKKYSKILETQTNSADEMKSYFGLKETEIPCVILFSTVPDFNEKVERYVFELEDKAYTKVKDIVANIESVCKKYEDVLHSYSIQNPIQNPISKAERKFLNAKKEIEARCCGGETGFNNLSKFLEYLDTVPNKSKFLKKTYDHDTIRYINQYEALSKNDPDLLNNIMEKYDNYLKAQNEEKERINKFHFESGLVFQSLLANGQTIEDLDSFQFSKIILEDFKNWVEIRQGYLVIKDSDEKRIQRTLDLLAGHICKENNWDLSAETNNGRGPVDFKISRGNDKTVIEIKLTSNSEYVHGLEVQIEEYAKAEDTDKKIYLLINNGRNSERVKSVLNKREKMVNEGKNPAHVVVIDATPKPSASKF